MLDRNDRRFRRNNRPRSEARVAGLSRPMDRTSDNAARDAKGSADL
jgi:hypothetical protein